MTRVTRKSWGSTASSTSVARISAITSVSVAPSGSQRCGRRPESAVAADRVPESSEPVTTSHSRPSTTAVVIKPSPTRIPSSAMPMADAASTPTAIPTPTFWAGFAVRGRFIAIVSKPRRVAMSEAAATMKGDGSSPRTSSALTKSITPSLLRSSSMKPASKISFKERWAKEVCARSRHPKSGANRLIAANYSLL